MTPWYQPAQKAQTQLLWHSPRIVTPYSSVLLTTWGQPSEFQTCFPRHRYSKIRVRNGKENLGCSKHAENISYPSSFFSRGRMHPHPSGLQEQGAIAHWQYCCDCTRAASENTQPSCSWAKVKRASELWKRSWRCCSAHNEAIALGKACAPVAKAKALLARNYF